VSGDSFGLFSSSSRGDADEGAGRERQGCVDGHISGACYSHASYEPDVYWPTCNDSAGRGGSEIFAGPSRSLVSLFQFGSDPLQPSLPGFIPRRPPLPRPFLACARANANAGRFIKPEFLGPQAKKDLASLNLEHLRRRGCLNLNVLT